MVVEIWSPSTGRYDINEKLPDYQQRGDLEIWYVHPMSARLTAWRRRPDGTYSESVYRGGIVRPESLPGVAIDLERSSRRNAIESRFGQPRNTRAPTSTTAGSPS